jgi:hypothetical protein
MYLSSNSLLQPSINHLRNFVLVLLSLVNYAIALVFIFIDFVAYSLARLGGLHEQFDDEFSTFVSQQLEVVNELEVVLYDEHFEPILALLVNKLNSSFALIVIWFAAFVLPFSHLAGATASNEYLLLCCILFTLFALYGRLSSGAVEMFTSPVQAIYTEACQQVNKAMDVCNYHAAAASQSVNGVVAFEQLLVVLAIDSDSTLEVDEVLVDQAVVLTAVHSLQALTAEESADEILDDALEELDASELSLEEVLEEAELE